MLSSSTSVFLTLVLWSFINLPAIEALTRKHAVSLDMDWSACRLSAIIDAGLYPADLSNVDFSIISSDMAMEHCVENAVVPGTILTTLIANGSFSDGFDPFYGKSMSSIPDIAMVGRGFYTFVFRTIIKAQYNDLNEDCDGVTYPCCEDVKEFRCDRLPFAWLELHGINYHARVFIDGIEVSPEDSEISHGTSTSATGMFHRWIYSLGKRIGENRTKIGVAVLVEPPDYPGDGRKGGQGGDHNIAKNAALTQFSAGWDWINATPDRHTGIYDRVSFLQSGPVVITDIHVEVNTAADLLSAQLDISVTISRSLDCNVAKAIVEVEILHTNLTASQFVNVNSNKESIARIPTLKLNMPSLWWPHTLGSQPLYTVRALVRLLNSTSSISDMTEARFGVRRITQRFDPLISGRIFTVNNVDIFLRGGNWIATDQLLRYGSSSRRYRSEVRLHVEMGLNIIRVWGGGLAERSEFYEATDEFGVLVLQEFWMTGDNNGRWAGSYEWPLDHRVYMNCVRDTIRELRNHPSLLLWCGGNELFPANKSPPPFIAESMRYAISTLDSGRFFISSSMSNYTAWDPATALAPKDGPYGLLDPRNFFERNPGLFFWNKTRADKLLIGFQPEIGSVSCPVMASLNRFIPQSDISVFPSRYAGTPTGHIPPPLYLYFKYLPFTDSVGVDRIYLYGTPRNTSDYAFQAQLAQYEQYKALFEGFQEFAWTRYSAVLLWKSQSPVPTFRGALYDVWLAQTGGFWGVRSAHAKASGLDKNALHVTLNLKMLSLVVVNLGGRNTHSGLSVVADIFDITGRRVQSSFIVKDIFVAANSVTRLTSHRLPWPVDLANQTLFVRLSLYCKDNDVASAVNEYWLTDPAKSVKLWPNFEYLRHSTQVTLDVLPCTCRRDHYGVIRCLVALSLNETSQVAAVYIRVTLMYDDDYKSKQGTDRRVLPAWSTDQYITILPKESTTVTVSGEVALVESLIISIDGWNIKSMKKKCFITTTTTIFNK